MPRPEKRRGSISQKKDQGGSSDRVKNKAQIDKNVVEAQEIGLKIFTPKERGWPKTKITA